MNTRKYTYIAFAAILLVFSASSFAFGAIAAQKKIVKFPIGSAIAASEVVSSANTDTDLFFTIWNTLRDKSIHFNEKTDDDRMYGAIKGLAASLGDPYTEFMPPSESKQFNESIAGSFGGIGAEIGKQDDILTVIAPLKNSPSEKAGLKTGDKILKINGTSSADMSIDEAIGKIRGPKGTVVTFDIYRAGDLEPRTIAVTRDTIVVPTLESSIVDDVFIISIYNFGEKASDDFAHAIVAYKKSGLSRMIIDLRGNPGGYLEASVDMASYFVPNGKTIVSEDFVKENKKEVHVSYGYKDLSVQPKLVVLIDGGSASASEIFAGALRDHKLATLVGVKTFGKGSVQELMAMPENTSLKVTIARWLTPSGSTIDKNGIKPDIEVKAVYDEKNPQKDNQMEKAIEVIKTK